MFSWIVFDILNNILTYQGILKLIVAIVLIYLFRFYYHVFLKYPRGPIPWPIIGNLLIFRKYEVHRNYTFLKLKKLYGPVFTIWFGPKPVLFICDVDLAKEIFNKGELCGRPDLDISKIFCNEKHTGLTFAQYGNTWKYLRNAAILTVNKYAKTDDLNHLINETIDENISLMKQNAPNGRPFQPKQYIYDIFATIIASSLFSHKIKKEESIFKDYKYFTTDFVLDIGYKIAMWEFIPGMKFFMNEPYVKLRESYENCSKFIKVIYDDRIKKIKGDIDRDFCDILLNAKRKALNDEKEAANHLTDDNLISALMDLSLGGVETSHTAFQWIVLLTAYYPVLQNKMRNEIGAVLGDRQPSIQDRKNLHYVNSFISESLRFRSPVPVGVIYQKVHDAKIGDFVIPKGTSIMLHLSTILLDDKQWSEPLQFNPERFLKDDKYISIKPAAYVPFGIGRRICPGEKLAYADLFLALVNFLQKTSEFDIILLNKNADILNPDPENIFAHSPKPYEIVLKNRIRCSI